ncbi:unnamed protein product (mitochondrion) [Plasmodiophora brassicae]|uniref:Uncharacterized protein n=1 Tax=Plasmodiophora brassicae TaxID=37360 RepID=A0A0G4J367_PLABS|nr:hypothetical protein PBRA_002358 [Plasmodiophora brassicae]SPQ93713.1 unnamed protein product [Plasmodiophora brassicae]
MRLWQVLAVLVGVHHVAVTHGAHCRATSTHDEDASATDQANWKRSISRKEYLTIMDRKDDDPNELTGFAEDQRDAIAVCRVLKSCCRSPLLRKDINGTIGLCRACRPSFTPDGDLRDEINWRYLKPYGGSKRDVRPPFELFQHIAANIRDHSASSRGHIQVLDSDAPGPGLDADSAKSGPASVSSSGSRKPDDSVATSENDTDKGQLLDAAQHGTISGTDQRRHWPTAAMWRRTGIAIASVGIPATWWSRSRKPRNRPVVPRMLRSIRSLSRRRALSAAGIVLASSVLWGALSSGKRRAALQREGQPVSRPKTTTNGIIGRYPLWAWIALAATGLCFVVSLAVIVQYRVRKYCLRRRQRRQAVALDRLFF